MDPRSWSFGVIYCGNLICQVFFSRSCFVFRVGVCFFFSFFMIIVLDVFSVVNEKLELK